jgi:hypothetical protein
MAGENGLSELIQRLLSLFATVISGSGSLPPSLNGTAQGPLVNDLS